MARARMPVSGYRPPALDLTDDPFRELDAAGLEQLIKSIAVDDERFAGIRAEIGNIVELWRIERQLELEPTRRQLSQSVASIARAARALEEAVGAAQPLEPDGEREHDPLAGHASDNPWALEGLYAAFERVYDPQDAGKDVFNGADEAFAHLLELLPLLARAAEDHCGELECREAAGERSQTVSANRRLFRRLVPHYEELFGTLGRSGTTIYSDSNGASSSWAPTGPAIRFFVFVFGRLLGEHAPTTHTLSTWIRDEVRERRSPSR